MLLMPEERGVFTDELDIGVKDFQEFLTTPTYQFL